MVRIRHGSNTVFLNTVLDPFWIRFATVLDPF